MDHKDFDAIAYANEMAARKKGKPKPPPKILREPGQIGTFVTKPFRVIKSDAGFEMTGVGNPDIRITGGRPPRPDRITREETDEEKAKRLNS